jgi:hypothetical protein
MTNRAIIPTIKICLLIVGDYNINLKRDLLGALYDIKESIRFAAPEMVSIYWKRIEDIIVKHLGVNPPTPADPLWVNDLFMWFAQKSEEAKQRALTRAGVTEDDLDKII